MNYRIMPHSGLKVSEIGFGLGYIYEADEKEIEKTIRFALDQGINFFDMTSYTYKPFPVMSKVFDGIREKVILPAHFGANFERYN